MRHPLNGLLRFRVPDADRQAILGDLEEEFRARVRPARSWIGAHGWYAGQIIAAAWSFRGTPGRGASAEPQPHRRLLDTGDLRYALRRWRRRPGFPLTAALTLGLGIGAATAMFSVVDAVLLRPLPWPEPDRLVGIHAVAPERRTSPDWTRWLVSRPAWDLLSGGSSFAEVAVWTPPSLAVTLDARRTEIVEAMRVSSNFLPTLGVGLRHGRNFLQSDDEQDTWSVILSYETWLRYFGGRPEVVGQPSVIAYASDTRTPPWVVVGVLEPGFSFDGHRPALLQPLGGNAEVERRFPGPRYRSVGRLAPGVSIESASAEAAALIQASQPDVTLHGRVVPLQDEQVGSSARPLWLLFGAAGVLLLVACANVAGLLVGENRTRRHETAIRLALGVTPGRIVRQLVVEHAMLASAGAVAGLVLAAWLTQGLVALAPVELPRLDAVRIDWRIAYFALCGGGATLLLFGIAPALSLGRTRAVEMLADGSRAAAPARHLTQRTVVAAEVALAAILVVGAGLLGETMFRLLSQPLGFDPSHLAIVDTRFTGSSRPPGWIPGTRGPGGTPGENLNRGPSLGERMAAIRQARLTTIVEHLGALPGVESAAGIGGPLFSARSASTGARVGVAGRPPEGVDRAAFRVVWGPFAGTLGTRLVSGRDLAVTDSRSVALVSREFERVYFPEGAVGRRFSQLIEIGDPPVVSRSLDYEIVGVVTDLKHAHAEHATPAFYAPGDTGSFVLRTAGAPEMVLPLVRDALAKVDPHIVVTSTTTVDAVLSDVIAAERFRATLSTAFAGVALVLAAVGLYGVSARRVADRRRELGIRVALGARPANLRTLVLRDGIQTVGLGLAVGLPLAFAASQATRALLFGVSPTAPHVFLLASLVLAAAAVVATFVPARRASRVDPIGALRE